MRARLAFLLTTLFLLPALSWSAVQRYTFRPTERGTPSIPLPQFFMADLETELPTGGVRQGDLAYTKDSSKLFKRTVSAWVEVGGGAGPGSANVVEVEVDFTSSGKTLASTTVTGQSWVSGTSKIICSPTMLATSTRNEGAEDAVLEQLVVAVHTRSAGVGFTVTVAPAIGRAYGVYKLHCTGAGA